MPVEVAKAPVGDGKVLVDAGQIQMIDSGGNLVEIHPDNYIKRIAEGMRPADAAEVSAWNDKLRYGDNELEAGLSSAAAAAADVGLAGPRAAQHLAFEAAGALGGLSEEQRQKAWQEAPLGLRVPTGREVIGESVGLLAGEEQQLAAEERMRGAARQNPRAAAIGQAAGSFIGGGGVLGGTGTIAQRLALAAAEGGALGVSQSYENAYIQNAPLTSQQILAGAGLGAVLGLGAEGAVAGAGRLLGGRRAAGQTSNLSKAMGQTESRASRMGLSDEISPSEQTAINALYRSYGIKASDLKALGRSFESSQLNQRKVLRDVMEYRLEDGTLLKGYLDDAGELIGRPGAIEKIVQAVDEVEPKLAKLRSQIDAKAQATPALKMMVAEEASTFLQRAEKEIIDPLRPGNNISLEAHSKAAALQSQLDEIAKGMGSDPTIGRLEQMRRQLGSQVYGANPNSPFASSKLELFKMDRMLEEHIEKASANVLEASPELGHLNNAYQRTKSQFHSFRHIKEAAQMRDRARQLAGGTDIGDLLTVGSAVLSGPAAGIKMGLARGAMGMIKDNWNHVVARVMWRRSQQVSKEMGEAVEGMVGVPKKGPGRPKKEPRLFKPSGAVAAEGLNFLNKGETKQDAYVRQVRNLSASVSDPVANTQRLAKSVEPISTLMPKLAGGILDTAVRAQQFLLSKITAGAVKTNPLSPLKWETDATDEEITQFQLYWEAAHNPSVVLEDMSKGMLVPEQVEALKAVYPDLFADLQIKVRTALANLTEEPSYDTKANLDLFLELNGEGEPSYAPDFLLTLAGSAGKVVMQEQAEIEQTGRDMGPGRPPNPGSAMRYASLGQQIESGSTSA